MCEDSRSESLNLESWNNFEVRILLYIKSCTDYPLENCNSDHFITPLSSEYFSKVRFGTVQCL